jgi:hypothetical protein
MAVSLHELLLPQFILTVVSRITEAQGRLGRWLGFHPTRYDPTTVSLRGPNIIQGDLRNATFRIWDYSRMAAPFRAPNTGPATISANPVGEVPVACARAHAKIPLSYEMLGNLSPVIGPNSQVDAGGQDYVQRNITHIARRFNNAVEVCATGMIQDSLYFQQQGDNWVPQLTVPSGFYFQVPFQIPAGNKTQLNMLGAGNIIDTSWDNVLAKIIQHIMKIKAAFAQLSGYPLTDVWINSLMWYNVIVNTEVRNLAGSANVPFAEYDMLPEETIGGEGTGSYEAVLRGDPTITWHINDDVVGTTTSASAAGDIDPSYSYGTGTLVKEVPDKMAFFCTKPSPSWTRMYHGGEYVVENPGMPGVLRRGYYFWKEFVTQPSAVELIGLANFIPLLFIPKIIAPASVQFP